MTVSESVQQMEKNRKTLKIWEYVMVGLFVGFFILILVIAFVLPDYAGILIGVGFGVAFIGVFIASFATSGKKSELRQMYKETFVAPLLQEYFVHPSYQYELGFSRDVVASFQLAVMSNVFRSSDYLTGTCKGISFCQADVKISHRMQGRNGKGGRTIPYFRGRMFIFELPGRKVQPVSISSKNFKYADKQQAGNGLGLFQTGNAALDCNVDVMAVDGQDISYLLTPQMVDQILQLHNVYGDLGMNFRNEKLYLCFHCEWDALDADMKQPIEYQQEREKMQHDLQPILDMAEALNSIPQR